MMLLPISYIKKYLGWRNWAVFYYNSIFENLFVFFYIALREKDFSNGFIIRMFIFLIFSVFSTTYGYLINDLADLELDKHHGKSNTFSDDSTLKAAFVVLIFLFLSVIFAVPFFSNKLFVLAWVIWLFFSTFYSLKPFRFKEWGKIGLVIVVIAQRVLPIFIVFSAFGFYRYPDFIILLGYLFFRGMTSDMNHQLGDYENDLRTNTKTSAVTSGRTKYQVAFNVAVEVEKLYLLFILIWITFNIDFFDLNNIPVFLLFTLFVFLLYTIELFISIKSRTISNPYDNEKNLNQVLILLIPNIILPFILLTKLIEVNNFYLIYYLLIIFIYRLFIPSVIMNSAIVKLFLKRLFG